MGTADRVYPLMFSLVQQAFSKFQKLWYKKSSLSPSPAPLPEAENRADALPLFGGHGFGNLNGRPYEHHVSLQSSGKRLLCFFRSLIRCCCCSCLQWSSSYAFWMGVSPSNVSLRPFLCVCWF